jgi:hypothetical protein
MHPTAKKRRTTRYWFYLGVVLIAVSMWRLTVQVYKPYVTGGTIFSESAATPAETSAWQKMGIQALADTNAQLTTLGTALLGALGLVLANKPQEHTKWQHLWAAFLAAIGGGVSLYFGYMNHLNLLLMISNQTFDAYDHVYNLTTHLQFYSLLAGAFFFADFAVHDLCQETVK